MKQVKYVTTGLSKAQNNYQVEHETLAASISNQGPIPLKEFKEVNFDYIEDGLRRIKKEQDKNKQAAIAKERQEIQDAQGKIYEIKKAMLRSSGQTLTYDFDGNVILAKKGQQNTRNIANISYKIGEVENVTQNKKEMIMKSKTVQTLPSINSHSVKKQASREELYSEKGEDQANTFEQMFTKIRPSQGVVVKGEKGESKAGGEYSSREFKVKNENHQVEPNIRRMTKKEYENHIKTAGYYFRPAEEILNSKKNISIKSTLITSIGVVANSSGCIGLIKRNYSPNHKQNLNCREFDSHDGGNIEGEAFAKRIHPQFEVKQVCTAQRNQNRSNSPNPTAYVNQQKQIQAGKIQIADIDKLKSMLLD